jgi:hypothetical protein
MEMSNNLKRIDDLICKHSRYDLGNQVIVSKNNQAIYIKMANNVSAKYRDKYIQDINKKIDKTMKIHTLKDGTIMIGSIATPDDAWLFQEAIVCSEMEELLALQKQILEMKTSLTSSLSDFVAANKALDPASPHFNKYSASSFSALC